MNVDLLDHGYVKFVESWGSDRLVIESARMSTDGAFRGWGPHYECRSCGCRWRNNHDGTISLQDSEQESCQECEHDTVGSCNQVPGDEKLLRYLYENKHATPFEFGGMTIEVQAPIFVFREWHRHRTQSYNEMSARYVPLPDLYYVPTLERVMIGASGSNKQAGRAAGADALTEQSAIDFIAELKRGYEICESMYKNALDDGVPKELARSIMPVGHYSRMRATANLRNWLAFLTLRMESKAQWEIRQYATAVGAMIRQAFPRTWELFSEERR